MSLMEALWRAAVRANLYSWIVILVNIAAGGGFLADYERIRTSLANLVELPERKPVFEVLFIVAIIVVLVLVWEAAQREMHSPRILFDTPRVWQATVYNKEKTEVRVPTMSFVSAVIRNDPISKREAKPVTKAYCIAEFFHANGKVTRVKHARWQEGDKPRYDFVSAGQTPIFRDHMNFMQLDPNGAERQIDFVVKDTRKDECYGFPAFGQDIYDADHTWQSKEHELPKGEYRVVLTIRGNEIDAPYPKQTLILENPGEGHPLTIRLIP